MPLPDPITKRQAASSLVRHIHPYAQREVLVPCFSVDNRFILGRSLGSLHIPTELGLPHIVSERCTDARFVLDLHHGSIVETRHYAATSTFLCIAHTAKSVEYIALPPLAFMRVHITFRRDDTVHMGASATLGSASPLPPVATTHQQQLLQASPSTPAAHFIAAASSNDDPSYSPFIQQAQLAQQQSESIPSHQQRHRQHVSQQQQELLEPPLPPPPSWQYFCTNYSTFLPTGALIASVMTEPGPASATFRKECILVTSNDPYAETFCSMHPIRMTTSQGRRIAPKRLLPRPT